MFTKIRAAVAALGLGTALLAPVATMAATEQPAHYQFDTKITTQFGAGEYDGTLRLTVYPDGIVQGYYRNLDDARFEPVSGGLRGDNIWLTLNLFGAPITGTFKDGKIVASALGRSTFGPEVETYTFEADVKR